MNKQWYTITLVGCDDETSFDLQLDDSQLELVNRLADMSDKTSHYECMPYMVIRTGHVADNPRISD